MKAIKIAVVMILSLNLIYSLYSWFGKEEPSPLAIESTTGEGYAYQDPASLPEAAAGLDLAALTALVKEVRSGQELERKLNEKGGVNNLDLDANDQVDYLFVKEFGDLDSKLGMSITAEPIKGEVQEIAIVTVEKNGDRAEIQTTGNEQIYGPQAIYNDWAPVERPAGQAVATQEGQAPVNNYFYHRPLWASPFFFGFYPPFFSFYPIMPMGMYSQRVTSVTQSVQRGPNSYQAKSGKEITSPDKGKTANKGIGRSLKNPTNTQRQFQATRSQQVRSGGFGRSGSRPAANVGKTGSSFGNKPSLPPSRSSSLGRGSSFGGGGVRSGFSRSRSFSFGGK